MQQYRRKLSCFAMLVLIAGFLSPAIFAQQKTVTLPAGTKVQKVKTGQYKFILPNKQVVEVRNFDVKTWKIGSISIIDPAPPDKPAVHGTQVMTMGVRKLTAAEAARIAPSNYIKIDDDVTWLPVTIMFIPSSANLLSPQPDPPGKK